MQSHEFNVPSEVSKNREAFEGDFFDEMELGLDLWTRPNSNPQKGKQRQPDIEWRNGDFKGRRCQQWHFGHCDGPKEGPFTSFISPWRGQQKRKWIRRAVRGMKEWTSRKAGNKSFKYLGKP